MRVFVTNPEVNSFGLRTKSFGSPTNVRIAIISERRILRAKAIVLLLRVGHALGRVRGRDEVEGVGEWNALDVCGGEAE